MDDSGILGRAGKLFASMAWTWPTAMFFSAIVIMLLIMTVWEFAQPTTERRGWLPMRTTRGDRLFIGLLGAAWIHVGWLMGSEQALWIGSIIAVVWFLAVMRFG
jgi:predicted small integral membrane protein